MRIVNEKDAIHFAFIRNCSHRYGVYVSKPDYDYNYSSGIHTHDFPQVWYCFQGKYRHEIGDKAYDCTAGSLVLVPPGVPHNVLFLGSKAEILMLDINYSTFLDIAPEMWRKTIVNLCMPAFAEELGYSPKQHIELSHASRLRAEELLSWLAMTMYAPYESYNCVNIYEKIEELFTLPEFDYPELDWEKAQILIQTRLYPVLRILSFLNIHYAEKIDYEQLLQEGGISRTGMYRYFRRVMGCTHSKYLQQLRAQRVLMSLRATSFSLSHIADICGFCDMHHMSQVFTYYYGMSPKKARTEIKSSYCKTAGKPTAPQEKSE